MVTNSRLVDQGGESKVTDSQSPSTRETFSHSEGQSKAQLGKEI